MYEIIHPFFTTLFHYKLQTIQITWGNRRREILTPCATMHTIEDNYKLSINYFSSTEVHAN